MEVAVVPDALYLHCFGHLLVESVLLDVGVYHLVDEHGGLTGLGDVHGQVLTHYERQTLLLDAPHMSQSLGRLETPGLVSLLAILAVESDVLVYLQVLLLESAYVDRLQVDYVEVHLVLVEQLGDELLEQVEGSGQHSVVGVFVDVVDAHHYECLQPGGVDRLQLSLVFFQVDALFQQVVDVPLCSD